MRNSTSGSEDRVIQDAIIEGGLQDFGYLIKVMQSLFRPDEIFPEDELEQWAIQNGYVKEEPC